MSEDIYVYISLDMTDTAIVNDGEPPGDVAGVHDTDCRSLERARLPSFFLYVADAFGGAMAGEVGAGCEV